MPDARTGGTDLAGEVKSAGEAVRRGCTCLADIDAKLEETGHFLDATILAAALAHGAVDKPLITIMRKDTWRPETRRGRKGKFIPSFCPFCGVRYPEAASRPASDRGGAS